MTQYIGNFYIFRVEKVIERNSSKKAKSRRIRLSVSSLLFIIEAPRLRRQRMRIRFQNRWMRKYLRPRNF